MQTRMHDRLSGRAKYQLKQCELHNKSRLKVLKRQLQTNKQCSYSTEKKNDIAVPRHLIMPLLCRIYRWVPEIADSFIRSLEARF